MHNHKFRITANFLNNSSQEYFVIKILFVCSGNIFRSVTVELCLKQYLQENKIRGFQISSTGTRAHKEPMRPELANLMQSWGLDPQKHVQRKVTKKILAQNDIVICMADYHQRFLLEKFGKSAQLYFDILRGKPNNLLDIEDVVPRLKTNKEIANHVKKTARFIKFQTPQLFKAINKKYLLFLQFEKGKRAEFDGLPYIPLIKSKKSIAFMSRDIPPRHPFHVLIIPKKLYTHIDDIPLDVQTDMLALVKKIGRISYLQADGYNVLINSGLAAGQNIYHTHIHVIPRKYNDGIRIELWKHRLANKRSFAKLNKQLQYSLECWKSSRKR